MNFPPTLPLSNHIKVVLCNEEQFNKLEGIYLSPLENRHSNQRVKHYSPPISYVSDDLEFPSRQQKDLLLPTCNCSCARTYIACVFPHFQFSIIAPAVLHFHEKNQKIIKDSPSLLIHWNVKLVKRAKHVCWVMLCTQAAKRKTRGESKET